MILYPIADNIFTELESEVRSYCRSFPAIFDSAKEHLMWDQDGREFIDFFSGAGALNYGHNNPRIKQAVINYLQRNGIAHSLDLYTEAKRTFLTRFNQVILKPRNLDYKIQFPGPTGTNAVEAALKLARKVTGRPSIMAFTNGFHGMTLGALSATANSRKRLGGGVPLNYVTRVPFDKYFNGLDTIAYIEDLLKNSGSGVDLPAAFLVETVQGEGGLNVASTIWLKRLQSLANNLGILLIVDDIQAGCGRTGSFFSFEKAKLYPDLVCLSKSISGIGLPMSLVLIQPKYDQWQPGEHNGTFRGNNLAFVAATSALEFWDDESFELAIQRKTKTLHTRLSTIAKRCPSPSAKVKGIGMMQGLQWSAPETAQSVSAAAFELGLIVETCGSHDHVLKLLPPLIMDDLALEQGLDLLDKAVESVTSKSDVQLLSLS